MCGYSTFCHLKVPRKLMLRFYHCGAPAFHGGFFRIRDLERREVEKRFYGGERKRLTASATFLLLR